MKKFFIAIIGGTVVLIGVAMIILPGPAVVVIPAGLAILATEFVWARRWMGKGKGLLQRWRTARASGLSWREAFKRTFSRSPRSKPATTR